MYGKIKDILTTELKNIEEAGLWKAERIILSPQSASINVKQGAVLNFCANNYLGLANNAELVAAAQRADRTVQVWTIDDPGRMRQLCHWGVDGIITNDVRRAVELLKEDDEAS